MSKVAIVTGGTRGIGAAISMALAVEGCQVAASYAGNEKAANKFSQETGINVFRWDAGSYEDCIQGVNAVREKLGEVQILVNNAGITRDAMMHRMKVEQWNEVINTNLSSMFYVTSQVIDSMRSNKFGRIINISSINSQKGQMGQTNYCAAKAGIIGFTKALAQENARNGVTVNAICPGYIDTDMVRAVPENVMQSIVGGIPVGRLGTAQEIARCVTFLASDQSGFITGSTISANGGQHMD